MGSSENFCLRWNDFESNVSGAFRELRSESDFFDVTLACDNSQGRTLQAHKVILSACSSFFKQMLRNAAMAAPGHPNPLLYLRGVRLSDLEAVLDFMYHGEVNVAQDDLNSFLAVAEDLQVKGLTQQNTKDLGGVTKKSGGRKGAGSTGPASKRRKQNDVSTDLDDDMNLTSVKNEPTFASGGDIGAGTSSAAGVTEGYEDGSGGVGSVGIDNFDESYGGYSGEGTATGTGEDAGMIGGQGMEAATMEGDSSKGRKMGSRVTFLLNESAEPLAIIRLSYVLLLYGYIVLSYS